MVTAANFPKEIIHQIESRHGKAMFRRTWTIYSGDGGNIPERFVGTDEEYAALCRHESYWRQADRGYAHEFPDTAQSDIDILNSALFMPDCLARNSYRRKAKERGYEL